MNRQLFKLRTIHIHTPRITTRTIMQNQQGQGVSHATGDSSVPQKVQEKAPQGLEEKLPESVCLVDPIQEES
jgi:hypothetical protein